MSINQRINQVHGNGTRSMVGDRVQSHPATDCWIRGDVYGTVTLIGRKYVHVRMDRSGRTRRFAPVNVIPLYDRDGNPMRWTVNIRP